VDRSTCRGEAADSDAESDGADSLGNDNPVVNLAEEEEQRRAAEIAELVKSLEGGFDAEGPGDSYMSSTCAGTLVKVSCVLLRPLSTSRLSFPLLSSK
jgi:hypothetical protein